MLISAINKYYIGLYTTYILTFETLKSTQEISIILNIYQYCAAYAMCQGLRTVMF